MSETTYTQRERAALGGEEGICRDLSDDHTFMCALDAGHAGDHHGFELPTVHLDEPAPLRAEGTTEPGGEG